MSDAQPLPSPATPTPTPPAGNAWDGPLASYQAAQAALVQALADADTARVQHVQAANAFSLAQNRVADAQSAITRAKADLAAAFGITP